MGFSDQISGFLFTKWLVAACFQCSCNNFSVDADCTKLYNSTDKYWASFLNDSLGKLLSLLYSYKQVLEARFGKLGQYVQGSET